MKKILMGITSALLAVSMFAGCSNTTDTSQSTSSESSEATEATPTEVTTTEAATATEPSTNPQIEITMKDGGVIRAELYPDQAPITVENFLTLVNEKFYDNLTFHRIVPGFVIQGGDPLGNGTGGSDKTIKGEFTSNNVNNTLLHERGVLSMARSSEPDSASSQFFITLEATPALDGDYAVFGKVLDDESMKVVDEIAGKATDHATDAPLEPVIIQSIRQVA